MTKVLNFFHIFLPKFQIQVINSKLTSGKNPLDIFVNNTSFTIWKQKLYVHPAKRDTLFTSKKKSSPGLYTPFRKQNASKNQMTILYYKTNIVRYFVFNLIKNQPLSETLQIQKETWELLCLNHSLNLR